MLMQDDMENLLTAVRTKDANMLYDWMKSESWATVEQLMDANGTK